MAFQTPITIRQALDSVSRKEYALPAIQREFVWWPDQIEKLFDSLMQGYPIGSFLFWKVREEGIRQYKFYDFVLDYHERDRPHCPPYGQSSRTELTAVLDGQQRLTALNIGLRGSYAYKLPRLWWKSPNAFPRRELYLNILTGEEENETGERYEFRFLRKKELEEISDEQCWYRVRDVLVVEDPADLHDFVAERELAHLRGPRNPFKILNRLYQVVHTELIISYYEERNQDLDRVLNIFIRTNSGGTQLTYSDMLMSMATAQWETLDAREVIHGTVDEINRIGDGFGFSKDFLLKAGLMLAGASSVSFKVTNFKRDNMKVVEEHWDRIASAVRTAVELTARFGFSSTTLSAPNAVLPIACYLYRAAAPDGFVSRVEYKMDRETIRQWLVRSLVKRGVWASGQDSLLTALRTVIEKHGGEKFPSMRLEEVMRGRGKSLTFEEEELQDLVESKSRAFALLSLLYPFVDFQSNKFHVDHVFPKSRFSTTRLRKSGVPPADIEEMQDRTDRLPNLQLLVGEENESKGDQLPRQWLNGMGDRERIDSWIERHDLGGIPEDMTGFNEFYEARRARLLERLKGILATSRREGD